MATDVLYNGVTLHNCLTRNWEQDIEYDESGTDAILSRFRLEFECTLHLQTALNNSAARIYVSGSGSSATDSQSLYQQISACLHEPRGTLEVTINGTTILRAVYSPTGLDADADIENGPRPRNFSIVQIVGDVYRVRFVVECAKGNCCNSASPFPQAVLNNRWGITETMDANFFTTRTIRGKIRVSQAMAQNLHVLRPMVVPTLERNFRRESIEFAVLPNGLEADFSITDRQVHTAAPYPATTMRATFEEANEQNTNFLSQISVALEGLPNADKRLLIARAVQVAEARLGDFNSFTDGTTLIEQIAISEEIGEQNRVEFRCRLRRVPPENSAMIGNIDAGTFGKPLQLPATPTSYDASQSKAPALWGYNPADPQGTPRNPAAVLYALQCYLQSPCDANHGILQISSLVNGTPPTQSGAINDTAITTTTVEQLPTWTGQSRISSEARTSMYLYSRMTSEYKVTRNRVQLPKAGDVTNQTAAGSSFVTLGRPQCVREIIIDGERVGEPPKMPNPLDSYTEGNGNTAKLLKHHVTPFPPTLSVDGTKKVWRARGYYLYGLSRAPIAGEKINPGVLPFTDYQPGDNQVGVSDLYDGRLGPGPQTSSIVSQGPIV